MDDSPMVDRLNLSAEDLKKLRLEKFTSYEYYIYGTDMKGNRLPSITGYTSDLNVLKGVYLEAYPNSVFIRIGVAIQEKPSG